jgi:hypothetical protein
MVGKKSVELIFTWCGIAGTIKTKLNRDTQYKQQSTEWNPVEIKQNKIKVSQLIRIS